MKPIYYELLQCDVQPEKLKKMKTPLSKLIQWVKDAPATLDTVTKASVIKKAKEYISEEKHLVTSTYVHAKMSQHDGLGYGMEYLNLMASYEAEAELYYKTIK